jgi:molecular chaperone GrpE (heat shock protein)
MTGESQESGHSPANESHDGGDGRVSSSDPQVTGNSDDTTSVETNASSSPGGSERATASAAEVAFHALRSSVSDLTNDVYVIGDFVRRCEETLLQVAERHRTEDMTPVLKSLMRIHGHVFRHIQATGRDKNLPDSFVSQILELVESELRNHGVETFHPDTGAEFDVSRMIAIGSEQSVSKPGWLRSKKKSPGHIVQVNHIAQINACGFTQATDNAEKLLQKAEVTVYQKPQPEQ